jgi:hypothetical protein
MKHYMHNLFLLSGEALHFLIRFDQELSARGIRFDQELSARIKVNHLFWYGTPSLSFKYISQSGNAIVTYKESTLRDFK